MSGVVIDKLINEISKLPGLGRKSAQRIALYLLKNREDKIKILGKGDIKDKVKIKVDFITFLNNLDVVQREEKGDKNLNINDKKMLLLILVFVRFGN